MTRNMGVSPKEGKRLKGADWYRNIAARWDHDMAFYRCEHIALMLVGPIAVCVGDISGGPCCGSDDARNSHSGIPVTWLFTPSMENMRD